MRALSERQIEVLQAMADGASYDQISERLFMARPTVKAHASSIYRKLGALNKGHAIALGMRAGLIH